MFDTIFEKYSWEEVSNRIYTCTSDDVQRSLYKPKKNMEDFLHLISPAAKSYLETMAHISRKLTQQRFGKTIQLYAPMYVSNECQNICTYCGFSLDNKIKRKILNPAEIMKEAEVLKSMEIDHILIVSGEASKTVGIQYFLKIIKLLKPLFANISMEIQPLQLEEYQSLHQAGVHSVLVYQETYHKEVYKTYHPKGRKSNFDYRLQTPDRIGQSQMHKIGLGVLLGLEDWRVDSFFNALHIDYLQKTYWKTKYSVSFPRLRPAEGVIEPNFEMKDADLLQLIFAYRIWNPDLDISVSTREREIFRNHIISLGATSMSAGSKTNPGGYATTRDSLEQFETSDERTMFDFKNIIKAQGYDPVMKDWDPVFG